MLHDIAAWTQYAETDLALRTVKQYRYYLVRFVAAVAIITVGCGGQPAEEARSTPSPSPTPSISPTPTESPTPEEEEVEEEPEPSPQIKPLKEGAVLAMLKTYLGLYNQGDYIFASKYLSSDVERECGGPTQLAHALSANHRIEQVDYDVASVKAWKDDPAMADVRTIERYGGDSYRLVLGLAFVFERGGWKLDDLYPIGAGAFC